MGFPKHIWDQLKASTTDQLERALEKDGFECDTHMGSERIYRHPDGRRASIHHHSKNQCYGRKLLTGLFEAAGWRTIEDMRRVGLVK